MAFARSIHSHLPSESCSMIHHSTQPSAIYASSVVKSWCFFTQLQLAASFGMCDPRLLCSGITMVIVTTSRRKVLPLASAPELIQNSCTIITTTVCQFLYPTHFGILQSQLVSFSAYQIDGQVLGFPDLST